MLILIVTFSWGINYPVMKFVVMPASHISDPDLYFGHLGDRALCGLERRVAESSPLRALADTEAEHSEYGVVAPWLGLRLDPAWLGSNRHHWVHHAGVDLARQRGVFF